MDENEALDEAGVVATPIFSVYRRGYDPEQVDRYVSDQQRRLDEALERASESERKLAAAVGQLRELHRRVAVYESEARSAQPPALDTLGERVQRILQEAWEGAYNLRQEAERDVNELRERTQREIEAERLQADRDVEELRQVASREAADLVDEATRRALALRDEMEQRRQRFLERVERDREQAVSQISFLYDQRQLAIGELARLKATVETTIEEMAQSPLVRPASAIVEALPGFDEEDVAVDDEASPGAVSAIAEDLLDEAEPPAPADVPLVFGEIIEDTDDSVGEVEPTDDDVPLPKWEGPGLEEASSEDASAEDEEASLAEETPTGQLEPIGYGYSRVESVTDETTDSDGEEQHRPYGGVYDVEADGWG